MGVGGIEAEAVMLGQPYFMLVPQVVGVRLAGKLAPSATATDLVLTITELLRAVGVVNRFVEYFGPGADGLSVADRATVANMTPEYGATCGFFPVDGETVTYLRQTGRSDELCERVEAYCRELALFREQDSPEPDYSWVVELDLGEVRPTLAGPRRPQERVLLEDMPQRFHDNLPALAQGRREVVKAKVELDGKREFVHDGDVVIASITSCTNTSNPALMLAAGLLARNAVALGLTSKRWVRDQPRPGLSGGHRLSGRGRPARTARSSWLRHGRLRLRHLHRQQRPSARRSGPGHKGRPPGRGGGVERQP